MSARAVWQQAEQDVMTLFQQASHGEELRQLGKQADLAWIQTAQLTHIPSFSKETGWVQCLAERCLV
jgi:hypothetical protein